MLAIVVSAIFGGLGVWHFAMALAPFPRESVAVPYLNGRPLFVPSVTATAAVGVGLLLCALLVVSTAGIVTVGLSPRVLSALCAGLALVLLLRAVGDFRYVGFWGTRGRYHAGTRQGASLIDFSRAPEARTYR